MIPIDSLRKDAQSIWLAGVRAVDSERLVQREVRNTGDSVVICNHEVPLGPLNRIAVVGAGKAGAGMASALEQTLGDRFLEKVCGWVNVPADCVRPLQRIHLHAARPAGVNEPTEEGVQGAERILKIVSQLGPDDLCLVLLSGGGSALLPAPVPGIRLEDKQAVTRFLMHAGATIGELNCVRKQLSRIKGGGLVRATEAGMVIAMIISDVIGDPLDIIASGPTVADPSTPSQALAILDKYARQPEEVPESVRSHLGEATRRAAPLPPIGSAVHNHVIGNNAVALNAAAEEARKRGYGVHVLGSANQGEARQVGRELAELCRQVRDCGTPVRAPACVLSGGEPVVHVVQTDQPQKGGRNQELVLAGLVHLWEDGLERILLLSGGTDGEDGPTDAAGAFADAQVLERAKALELDPNAYLAINNSYAFFEPTGSLLRTGPTHTNVMDLRVAMVSG